MKTIIKKLALALVVFLQMSSFAAVISDNDGSAFISRPEYDSLKNDFQSRLDEYNTSIDNKIQDAIAKYLAGVQVSKTPIEMWSNVMYATNNKFRFASYSLTPGSREEDIVNKTTVNVTRVFNHPECEVYSAYLSLAQGTAGIKYQIAPTLSQAEANSTNVTARAYTSGISKFTYNFTNWIDCQWNNHAFNRKENTNTFYDSKVVNNGVGNLWEFNILPNEKYELKKYNSTCYIEDTIDIRGYTYKDCYTEYTRDSDWSNFQSIYCTGGALNDTDDIEVNIPKGTGYEGGTEGSIPDAEYEATLAWKYGKQTLGWSKVDDGIDYSFYFWGNNIAQTLNGITESTSLNWNAAASKNGKGTTADNYEYKRVYYPCKGNTTENVKVSNISYTYYEPVVEPINIQLNQIENQYVSSQADEVIVHGNGVPILEAASDNSTIRVKDIVINLYDKNNPESLIGGSVRIMISKNKFNNGTYAQANDRLYDTTVSVPSSGIITVSMGNNESFTVAKKGEKVWMNIFDVSGNGLVKLVSLSPVLTSD